MGAKRKRNENRQNGMLSKENREDPFFLSQAKTVSYHNEKGKPIGISNRHVKISSFLFITLR